MGERKWGSSRVSGEILSRENDARRYKYAGSEGCVKKLKSPREKSGGLGNGVVLFVMRASAPEESEG